ncbi:hypothetical protein AKJ16_DCAP09778 [Drosera capensis]
MVDIGEVDAAELCQDQHEFSILRCNKIETGCISRCNFKKRTSFIESIQNKMSRLHSLIYSPNQRLALR